MTGSTPMTGRATTMDDEDGKARVTEVSASHSKKKPTEQYGNINVHTSATAEVLDGDDPEEVQQWLDEFVKAENERAVAERYEAHIREDSDEE